MAAVVTTSVGLLDETVLTDCCSFIDAVVVRCFVRSRHAKQMPLCWVAIRVVRADFLNHAEGDGVSGTRMLEDFSRTDVRWSHPPPMPTLENV